MPKPTQKYNEKLADCISVHFSYDIIYYTTLSQHCNTFLQQHYIFLHFFSSFSQVISASSALVKHSSLKCWVNIFYIFDDSQRKFHFTLQKNQYFPLAAAKIPQSSDHNDQNSALRDTIRIIGF